MSEKPYCPEFLYDITVGLTVYEFLVKDYSLEMIGQKYSRGLSDRYMPIPIEEITAPAEEIVRFMSELKSQEFEAHDRANHYVYYKLKFDGLKGARKLKGFFGDAFDGDKKKVYSEVKVFKDFKAYTFALRNGSVEKAPSGWQIKTEKDIDFFQDIIAKDFTIDDIL